MGLNMGIEIGKGQIVMKTQSTPIAKQLLMGKKFSPKLALEKDVVQDLYKDRADAYEKIQEFAADHGTKSKVRAAVKTTKMNMHKELFSLLMAS